MSDFQKYPERLGNLGLDAALMIIDVQKGFDDPGWGHRNNPDAEDNIALLLA